MGKFNSLVGAGALVASASLAAGQSSPLVLIGGYGNGPITVVQNGQLVNQWTYQGDFQSCLAVGSTIRTLGAGPGQAGQEFDFSGNPTGNTYTNGGFNAVEGTTDGTYNYALDYNTRGVYRSNADWSNPQLIFTASQMSTYGGITYDVKNGTLWTSEGFGGGGANTVREYDMQGNVLSSFQYQSGRTFGLAYEPATDTLWAVDYDPNILNQYSKQGQLLQTIPLSIGGANYSYSAEFAITAIPTPGAGALLGVAGLLAGRRRRS